MANRLWNGKIIKKLPMLKANSVLRAKNKANADQVIWTNEIPTIFHLFWAEGNNRENEWIVEKTKFQLKLVKWSKKNANYRSHLRKIDENVR